MTRKKEPKKAGAQKPPPARPEPVRRRLRLLPRLIILALIGMLAATGMYFYVDQLVVAQLRTRDHPVLSALYSDLLSVTGRTRVNFDRLKQQLIARRYREIGIRPSSPGEFSSGPSTLIIYTREFIGADGQTRPARLVHVTASRTDAFELEPQIVTALGDGEIRAAENKALREFPVVLLRAVLAIEDERFYSHHGIDFQGLARAAIQNVLARRIVQGGSTLTQQLAKNLFFTPQRSIKRKVLEMFAALSLERHLSKNQILELYLNEVYLGQEGSVAIHGFAKAAATFFGKKVEDLTLTEAALLAGLVKAPSAFSPRNHLARAVARRNIVVEKMAELELISRDEANAALKNKPLIVRERQFQRRAPHLVASLQQNLSNFFDVETALLQGVSVYTGLDIDMQQCGESAVREALRTIEKTFPKTKRAGIPLEAGLVSIEPFSGKIKAWVGGRDYSDNQFDHVSQARRQIGSTIKPFLYLTALDGRLNSYKTATPISILSDRPMTIDLVTRQHWEPENFDHEYRGDVTLRYALEHSLNMPAVYTVMRFGVEALARTARSFRISDKIDPVPALALGAADTTLLDLTAAYAALANGGIYISPRSFLSARDAANRILASPEITEERVANENAVFVLSNILEGVVERGTAHAIRQLGYHGPVAGKTGTSNETRDAWFVGFTPDLATGVWVGYDDNKKTGLTGGALAVPIWTAYMKCVAEFHSPADFIAPPGVIFVTVDSDTGRRVTPECPAQNTVRELFVRGTEPPDCESRREPAIDATQEEIDATSRGRRRERSFWDLLWDRSGR